MNWNSEEVEHTIYNVILNGKLALNGPYVSNVSGVSK